MKKYITILIIIALFIPSIIHAQVNVFQGGTGTSTLPVGQILFGKNALRLTSDPLLFWDNSNKFLGVGTSTPNAILDVDSNLSILGGYINGFRPAISSGSIGDEIGLISATDDKIISAYQTGTNKFFFGTNDGLSGVTVDGSTGFVGVSTSSPEVQLDVWGDAYLGNPTGGTARAFVGAVNASFGAGNEAGIWAYDPIYGTQQIGVFDNNQNFQYGGTFGDPGIYIKNVEAVANPLGVGIRTIDPASLLSVNGNGSFGASYDTIAAPTNGLIVEGNTGLASSSPSNSLVVSGTGAFFNGQFTETATQKGIYLGRPSGAGSTESGRAMFSNGVSAQNWEIDNSGGTFRWFLPSNLQMTLSNDSNGLTLSNSTNGVLHAKGSLSSYFTGNLGVGTTTPASRLVARGAAGLSTNDVFAVASSTNATVFAVNGAGNIEVGGGTPTLSANCGTSATLTTGSTDTAGSVTLTSSGAVNACTINFAKTRLASPISAICNVTSQFCYPSARSTTAVTFTFGDESGGAVMDYLLIGQ